MNEFNTIIITISTIISALSAVAVAVLTKSLVSVTKEYVMLTRKLSQTNTKMVEEMNRPYVVVNIFTENTLLKLSIKNFGNRPAKNVDITFTPDIDVIIQKIGDTNDPIFESKSLLKQSFIPPEYEIRNILYYGANYFERTDAGEHEFNVVVKYSDELDKNYEEVYNIDFKTFYFKKHAAEFSDNFHLGQTHKEIKSLKEELVKVINKIELA